MPVHLFASGAVSKLDLNYEAGLIAMKMADRNAAAEIWSILRVPYDRYATANGPMPDARR